MNPDRHDRIRRLFAEARRLEPAARRAFLDRECGDDAGLRREVEGLLAHDQPSSSDVADPIMAPVSAATRDLDPVPDVDRPERIGRYRILDVLGEGGMGTVYRAEQVSPIQREVALKLMRLDRLSPALRARFETERQTLARMDHPNIAKVYDADFDDEGRPYLGMELIDGPAITDFCRERQLSVRGRLALWLAVCRGVGHAHRKGVIHRDLKPSNILIKRSRDAAVPKLIDFSIAKTLETAPSEYQTRTGQIIGTLAYMSPEQARGEIGAIDTRTDVYALGVIAYEMLTGRLPHDIRDLPLHEAVRRLSEEPVASMRTTHGGTTGGDRIPADAATIVGKCLEKLPEQRYRNADEVADDLERFLSSRPILARPPTTFYQLRMLAGRHKIAVGAMVMLFGFLAIYGVTVSYQLRLQRAARIHAEQAADEARREARRSASILAFLQDMLDSAAPDGSQGTLTVRELFDRTARRIDTELAHEPEALANAHYTLGTSYRGLGLLDDSLTHLNRALDLHRTPGGEDTPDALRDRVAIVGIHHLSGDLDQAVAQGPALLEQLLQAEDAGKPLLPSDETIAFELSLSAIDADRQEFEEAERLARDALQRADRLDQPAHSNALSSARSGVAFALWSRGGEERFREAEELARLAVADLEATRGEYHPETLDSLNLLAVILTSQERRLESAAIQREALERRRQIFEPGHPAIAVGAHNLASALLNEGLIAAAAPFQQEALENWRASLGPDHPYVGIALSNLGFMQHCLGDLGGAERFYRETLAIAGDGPSQGRSVAEQNLVITLKEAGRSLDEAERLQRRAQERVGRDIGADTKQYARGLSELGHVLLQRGRLDEAEAVLREAGRLLAELSDEPPVYVNLGLAMLLERSERTAEARRLLDEVVDLLLDDSLFVQNANYQLTHATRLAESWGDVELAERFRAQLTRRKERMHAEFDVSALGVADRPN